MAKTTGLASIAEGRSDLHNISPYKLNIRENWNTRDMNAPDNVEHIDMLAQSIAEIGVQEPLTVYWEDGKAYVTNGHCRLLAAIRAIEVYKAELQTVPVRGESRFSNEADRIFSQISRNSGKPFTPMEQAKVFQKLLNLGWLQTNIAKKAGLTSSRVSQILDLLTLPEPVKTMVVNGSVSATMAVQTVKEQGTAAEQVLKTALETANAEGKTKVKPDHVQAATVNTPGGNWGEPKVNLRTLIKDVLDHTDVNDSGETDVVLTMSNEQWKRLRDAVDW